MRSLFIHGKGDVRVENLPDPSPDDTDGVVVKVERTAICGSDLHIYHGDLGEGSFGIGHEAIGEVVEAGSGVRRFRTGDRVIVSGVVGCAQCGPCNRGSVTSCENDGGRVFGTNNALPGAQAEAIAVPKADTSLAKIPEGVSDASAVLLTDILPTGYLGAENANIAPGQDVAVVGCGPVGLMAVQTAQLFGPRRVFALDRVPARLAAAKALGALPIDVTTDPIAPVLDLTDGLGPHSVIEAVGAEATILTALQLVRKGGTVSVVGVPSPAPMSFPMALALVKNLTFRIGVCPVPKFWPHLVPLIAEGRLQPDSVFTHEMSLGEGPEAYALFDSREDGVLKVMLDPTR